MTDKKVIDAGKTEPETMKDDDLFKFKPVSQPEIPDQQLGDEELDGVSGGRRASCGAGTCTPDFKKGNSF